MNNDHLVLTQRLREICVGTMLGDATMQTQSKGKTYRIKFQMSLRHQDYADKICQEFGNVWIPSQPHLIHRKESHMMGFQTLSTSSLLPIAKLFFKDKPEEVDPKRRKTVSPLLVENELSALGLAYWFMDDGSRGDWTPNQGKQIHLHTHGFTLSEVESLCNGIQNRFGLKTTAKPNRNAHIVLISGSSYEDFVGLVDQHMVQSLRSRLPLQRLRKKKRESKGFSDRFLQKDELMT